MTWSMNAMAVFWSQRG
jgi:hypothetical protein